MRSYLKIENTSSVTLRVPPSPTGEGYSILQLILQTYCADLFVLDIFELLRLKYRSAFVACDDEVVDKLDLQGI